MVLHANALLAPVSDVCIGKDLGHCRRINVVAGRAARAARLPLSWLDVAGSHPVFPSCSFN